MIWGAVDRQLLPRDHADSNRVALGTTTLLQHSAYTLLTDGWLRLRPMLEAKISGMRPCLHRFRGLDGWRGACKRGMAIGLSRCFG